MKGARTVLDVGSGTGIASEQLLGKGVNVLAVEPDLRMAEVARDKGIPVEIGTFENWDPAQRRFDLVVFVQPFHWLNPHLALPKVHALLYTGVPLALMWYLLFPPAPTHG